jgi:uncharacterized protein YdcH (DUF465 family)
MLDMKNVQQPKPKLQNEARFNRILDKFWQMHQQSLAIKNEIAQYVQQKNN